MLLNIPQCTGQPPAIDNLLAQNVSRAQVKVSHFTGAPLWHSDIAVNDMVSNISNILIMHRQMLFAKS